MEQNKIDMFIMQHDEQFSAQGKLLVRQKLQALSEDDMMKLNVLEFKSPSKTLIFAWLLAGFGVNGFYIKKTGWGYRHDFHCGNRIFHLMDNRYRQGTQMDAEIQH